MFVEQGQRLAPELSLFLPLFKSHDVSNNILQSYALCLILQNANSGLHRHLQR